MSTNRRPLLIVVAVVLAAAAGLFAFDYLTQPRQAAAPPQSIIVAARAINAREPIDPTMVTTQTVPASQVAPGSFASATGLNGDVALVGIPAGTPITSSNVGRASQIPTIVHLQPGMRAMSIPVDEIKDVSGLLEPGDHVDVYAILQHTASTPPESLAILRNLTVLSVGGTTTPPSNPGAAPNNAVPHSITLEVTAQQAKTLSVADVNSTLRLALRPPGEPTRSEPTDAFIYPQSAPAPAQPVAQPPPTARIASAAAPPQNQRTEPGDNVEYIFGDRVEQNGSP